MQSFIAFLFVFGFFAEIYSQPSNFEWTKADMLAIVKFNVARNISKLDTVRQIQSTVGNQSYSERHIRRVYDEFMRGGRLSCNRREGSGRPNTAQNEENEELLEELMDRTRDWTIPELAYEMNIGYGSVQAMLKRLGWRRLASRWVPIEMTCLIRTQRVRIANMALNELSNDRRYLTRIVAIDETIIRNYQPLSPLQSSEWRKKGESP